jgi:hypothetical protein
VVDSPSAIQRIIGGVTGGGARGNRRLVWVGVGLGAVAVAALIVGVAVRGDGPAPAPTAAAGTAKGAAPSGAARPSSSLAGDSRLEEVRTLVARGEWERAIGMLQALRSEAPDAAEPPYMLATISLDHRRFAEGLAAAQLAVRRDPSLKSDPDLIKGVIQALASDASYERAQNFLRNAGSAATPFIKEAARRDPNAKVRDRASDLLEGRGWSWSSRPSSGGSMFHR